MALHTVRAAAEQLGVAYSTLKRWVHTGNVRTTRTEGGHHRISDNEIDRLLARQQPERRPRRTVTDVDESLDGLSARNRLHGFIDEVRIDGLLAQVRMRVGDQSLTAVITADAVRALKLRRGDDALAIIKSTEVMIARAGRAGRTAEADAELTASSPRARARDEKCALRRVAVPPMNSFCGHGPPAAWVVRGEASRDSRKTRSRSTRPRAVAAASRVTIGT